MKKRFWGLLLVFAMLCGLSACGQHPAVSSPPGSEQTLDVDVVIVGAGGAGMTAGIVAARAGKKVVILEKASTVGGNSARSTGGMNAAKTEWQDDSGWGEFASVEHTLSSAAEDYPELEGLVTAVQKEYDSWKKGGYNGYFDSVGLFILDTMVNGKNGSDLELVTTLAENSADALDWLDTVGAQLHSAGFLGGASVKRGHRPVDDKGKTVSVGSYLTSLLEQACIDNAVEILFDTPVTEILMEDGRAVGVKAGEQTFPAKSVILASGGFGADSETVSEWRPELDGFPITSAPGCTGDGIRMAQNLGADTVDLAEIQIHPTVEQSSFAPVSGGLRKGGAILVNDRGLRFCNETDSDEAVSAAVLKQTGGYAWLLLDQRLTDDFGVLDDPNLKDCAVRAMTWAGLARAMGVPADTLSETVESWNESVTDGKDKEFERTDLAALLDVSSRCYAIKVAPAVVHTMGGVRIDTFAQVLDTDGSPIPGLFAAGEVTGGVHGAGYLEGNGLTDAVVFGRIAGENAAAYVEAE